MRTLVPCKHKSSISFQCQKGFTLILISLPVILIGEEKVPCYSALVEADLATLSEYLDSVHLPPVLVLVQEPYNSHVLLVVARLEQAAQGDVEHGDVSSEEVIVIHRKCCLGNPFLLVSQRKPS